MLQPSSLMTRIIIGKGIGFAVGLILFTALPLIMADPGWLLRWGVLFWYTTVGAFIGVFGVFTWHPLLKLPMPWWFRAPLIGGWMNFVLTFFAYDDLQRVINAVFGENGPISSPFWVIIEGMLVGLLIGYFATRFGGEGKEIVDT
jgi:hypothetical protein